MPLSCRIVAVHAEEGGSIEAASTVHVEALKREGSSLCIKGCQFGRSWVKCHGFSWDVTSPVTSGINKLSEFRVESIGFRVIHFGLFFIESDYMSLNKSISWKSAGYLSRDTGS